MNIRERLEAGHSKSLMLAIVNYIGDDKKRFKELLDIFFNGDYRLTQRAAWPLSYIAIEQPQLIAPYLDQLVKKLQESGHHPAIARNILRLLQEITIPEAFHGTLTDVCFGFIINETIPVAIRAFAITVAANICSQYAELKAELLLILNDLRQFPQPPAINSRIKSALKLLQAKRS